MAAFGACACKLSWTLLFDRPGSAPIWGGKKGEFRDWTRLGCERAVITINRPNLVKIPFLSDVEVDRESLGVLNILAPIRNFSSEKVHVNWRFKTSCLKMHPIPQGTLFLLVLGIPFALLC